MNIDQLKAMTRGVMLDAPESHGWAMYDHSYELVKTFASTPKPREGYTICSRSGVVMQASGGGWRETHTLAEGVNTIEDDVRKLAMDAQALARRFRARCGGELSQDALRMQVMKDFNKWLLSVAENLEGAHKDFMKYAGSPQSKLDI